MASVEGADEAVAVPPPVIEVASLPPRDCVIVADEESTESVGPAERTEDRWKFGSCRFRLTLKLLLRDIFEGPLSGFTESSAVVVMPPPLPLLEPLPL